MITIWHNPRCSKSRQTLALLEKHASGVNIRRYLEDAPSLDEIRTTHEMLGGPLVKMIRTGETVFKELSLSKSDPDNALLAAMAAHPILIERPIVFANGTAAIGRPPESVLSIL